MSDTTNISYPSVEQDSEEFGLENICPIVRYKPERDKKTARFVRNPAQDAAHHGGATAEK